MNNPEPKIEENTRPRLLVLSSTYPRWKGDPEPGFVHQLSQRLTGEFDVTVLCPHAPGALHAEYMDGVRILRYRYAPQRLQCLVNDGGIISNLHGSKWKYLLIPSFVIMQIWSSWQLVRRNKIDVIHAHWLLPQGLIAALLQHLHAHKLPVVVTSHGADLYALRGKLLNWLKRIVVNRSCITTVVSLPMQTRLEQLGANARNIKVLPMGVDTVNLFRIDNTVARSSNLILFVGRLVEKKGAMNLVDAMPIVLKQIPDARLIIVGFGPEQPALAAKIQEIGLQDSVTFAGAVTHSQLPHWYQHAALLVAPFVRSNRGDEDGLGLVLIEAIACGCPILAGKIPATEQTLEGEFTDMLIDPLATASMAESIIASLSNPGMSRLRAQQLHNAVAQQYEWNVVARNYAGVLKTAISDHSQAH